jgi:hypothetical protein
VASAVERAKQAMSMQQLIADVHEGIIESVKAHIAELMAGYKVKVGASNNTYVEVAMNYLRAAYADAEEARARCVDTATVLRKKIDELSPLDPQALCRADHPAWTELPTSIGDALMSVDVRRDAGALSLR